MLINEFTSLALCEEALFVELRDGISTALTMQHTVNLALAGGNTPKGLYKKLNSAPLDWENIAVTLTDERWVDGADDASNEKMLKQTLFQNKAKMAQFLGLKTQEKTPLLAQPHLNALLQENLPALDFVILGMGDDGHFASIFPQMDNTQALLDLNGPDLCLPAHPLNKPARMSLTLPYLLTAKRIFLFITGVDKKEIIKQQSNANTSTVLPIYSLLHQTLCPVTIYWSET